MTLQGSVALAFYRNAVVLDIGLTALTGAKDDVDGVPFGFRHISVVEFVFVSDFDYLEAFGYHKGRELPEFLEKSVGVHNDRKVFGRVICCNSEIVCRVLKNEICAIKPSILYIYRIYFFFE